MKLTKKMILFLYFDSILSLFLDSLSLSFSEFNLFGDGNYISPNVSYFRFSPHKYTSCPLIGSYMTLLLSICPPVQSVDGRGQRRERVQVIGQEDGTVFSLAVAALLEGIKRAAAAAADNMTTKLLGITALVATPTLT